ncbi:MAG: CdaR family protein [Chloroflexales bacterium]|nr:CdaR family protein [Chloroflexales bacterium]
MKGLRATSLRLALAFGLSFALWAFVSVTENPEERIPFEDMLVDIRGLAPDLTMVDQNGLPNPAPPTVELVLRTDQATQNSLRQADVQAFVDLSTVTEPGERRVPVNTERTRPDVDFTVTEIEPSSLTIRLERLITTTVPLTVTINGNPLFGFAQGEAEVTVNDRSVQQVQVSGPQSRVDRVERARVTARIDQRSASYSSDLNLQALDSNSQIVEGVNLDPGMVSVFVPIRPSVGLKQVPVLSTIIGSPATGYVVASVQSAPPLITLVGSSDPLDKVQQLSTESVDISGATDTFTRSVSITPPAGTSLRSGEPSQVIVTVQIIPIERPFQVQLPVRVQVTGVTAGLRASVNPEVIELDLTGSLNAIDRLGTTTLLAQIDANGRGAGTYSLRPQLALPAGVSVVGDIPTITLTLTNIPAPPTSTPSLTQTPTPTPPSEETALPEPEPSATSEPVEATPEPPEETATPQI